MISITRNLHHFLFKYGSFLLKNSSNDERKYKSNNSRSHHGKKKNHAGRLKFLAHFQGIFDRLIAEALFVPRRSGVGGGAPTRGFVDYLQIKGTNETTR